VSLIEEALKRQQEQSRKIAEQVEANAADADDSSTVSHANKQQPPPIPTATFSPGKRTVTVTKKQQSKNKAGIVLLIIALFLILVVALLFRGVANTQKKLTEMAQKLMATAEHSIAATDSKNATDENKGAPLSSVYTNLTDQIAAVASNKQQEASDVEPIDENKTGETATNVKTGETVTPEPMPPETVVANNTDTKTSGTRFWPSLGKPKNEVPKAAAVKWPDFIIKGSIRNKNNITLIMDNGEILGTGDVSDKGIKIISIDGDLIRLSYKSQIRDYRLQSNNTLKLIDPDSEDEE
jgi:hypothetical protein